MGKFNWQSDDEIDWPEHERKVGHRIRWTLWLIALGLIVVPVGAVGLTLYLQARAALRQAEQAVRQSGALIVESSAAGDDDLFKSLVSGRDRGWATTVLSVNRESGFFTRRANRSLRDDPPLIFNVNLSPDLSQSSFTARIETPLSYRLDQTMVLDVPLYLGRHSDGKWVLAAPDPDFWGREQFLQLDRVGAVYPTRDDALVKRLLNTLNRGVLSLCAQQFKLDCPDQQLLTIIFSTDPSALTIVQQPRPFYVPWNRGGQHQFIVPAPSLLGMPSADQTEAFLEEFYVRPILFGLIASQTGYLCCEHPLYFAALAEQMVVEAELVDPILIPQDFVEISLREDVGFDLRNDVGWRDRWLADNHDQQWPKALAVAAFIRAADPDLPTADAIRQIGDSSQSLSGWLRELLSLSRPTNGHWTNWQSAYWTFPSQGQ